MVPDDPRSVLPGLRVPVCTLTRDQESIDNDPLVTLLGLAEMVQVGGRTTGGGVTTGVVVTDTEQVLDHNPLVTPIV